MVSLVPSTAPIPPYDPVEWGVGQAPGDPVKWY